MQAVIVGCGNETSQECKEWLCVTICTFKEERACTN